MKVSVILIAYNHEKFIAQALDSILEQIVDFDYEIVIGEDCSTDKTQEIVSNYKIGYPDKIKILPNEVNIGAGPNFIRTLEACSGEYIAYLDGDDYWASSSKLQMQADFLDTHPECSACFHNVNVVFENEPGKNYLFHNIKMKHRFTLLDIVSDFFIPTCSTMFRSQLFGALPDWYINMPMGDWPLHVLNAQHGDYGYIDEVMANYRVHGNGSWSGQKRVDILSKTITASKVIDKYLDYKFHNKIKSNIHSWYFEMANCYLNENAIVSAYSCFFKSITVIPSANEQYIKQSTDMFARIFIKQIRLTYVIPRLISSYRNYFLKLYEK